MSDSNATMAIITNLFSGFGGVCIGALITYYLQEKSSIEKKKTEILSDILNRGFTGVEILKIIARTAMVFQSQDIDTHIKEISNIYNRRGGTSDTKNKDFKNKFIALAISMRDNIGVNTEVISDKFVKNMIEHYAYSC